ncbi:B12-binding domain-containing radical SAM protein [Candidatus Eisenbacteria bacterium]|uniref:B12-binding domain-containing radical SAM protein n=1 Tax=Eiseniibacteriota bacterium TaxID=2212470 RepID=A0ABV6YP23_UNCEI
MMPREWSKRLVDVSVTKLRDKDLEWADCAFIGGMTVNRESAHQIITRCKEAGLKVVAGGPLFTMEHEEFGEVDHFVLNEAELTLPEFLRDFERGCARRIYTATGFADIHTTPAPMWELADLKRYGTMSIQFSRGCPHNCEFCNVTSLFGHRPRTKKVEQVLAELDGLYDLGWRGNVFFVDDNLIGNKANLKAELLPALIEWRKDKKSGTFSTEVTINLADDEELMRMMAEAGFGTVFIGIETPDDDSLAECSKKQNMNRDLVEDVKRMQRAGFLVDGGFIVGFDNDTPGIFQRQIDFIQKSGIVNAMVGMLQAPPGTRLHERLKQAGRLLEQMSGDNVDGTTNIIPVMSLDALKDGYKQILERIYAPKPYYQRVRTFLREYKPPKIKASWDFEHVLAFIRSIGRLGILGKERAHYWHLLWWTLFRCPRSFRLAMALAVYGYHLRRVCELHVL